MFTKQSLIERLKTLKQTMLYDTTQFKQYVEIINALIGIPYEEKKIIFEFYLIGTSWEQIAAEIGCSARRLRDIRHNALNILLYRLNEKSGVYIIASSKI